MYFVKNFLNLGKFLHGFWRKFCSILRLISKTVYLPGMQTYFVKLQLS